MDVLAAGAGANDDNRDVLAAGARANDNMDVLAAGAGANDDNRDVLAAGAGGPPIMGCDATNVLGDNAVFLSGDLAREDVVGAG
jgi:hypothetical protein